ncbi:hypothetical protein LCGC14_1157090 [marine sediment metagenome]|uniref:Uncharacterized protein n=1 Tax=marine sediment metagenome TaxID=412755 RepID=A0A0F9LTS3_9ZZZZ
MENKTEPIEEEQKTALVPAIGDDNIIAIAAKAEERVNAINKIKRISLKVTNPHDWVDQSGKPYLQASGSEKVARLFGISWRIDEPSKDNEEGGHFTFTYKGYFSLSGITIEVIGTRSSKDPFFKRYSYSKDENNNSIKTELPVSEIDKTDVKKAAFTNCIGNGITRLLGIRNLTYDDLIEAGIDVKKITEIDYKKGGKDQKKADYKIKNPDAPATQKQQQAIHTMLGKLGHTDDYAKHAEVSQILKMEDVITSMGGLNMEQAGKVIPALQKLLEEQK